MDQSESLVEQYLRSLGFSSVIYEPDGNVPPDFLADHQIAVEVRRLNQNYTSPSGTTKGLEETLVPLWQRLEHYLPKLGPSRNGESWYVCFSFVRPAVNWRTLKPKLRAELETFMRSSNRGHRSLSITDTVALDLIRAGRTYSSFFVLGTVSNNNSGGAIIEEVERNLRFCIDEKTQKIAQYRHKYSEWWLILPDYIGFGLDLEDQQQFRQLVNILHTWNKVILLDPRAYDRAFEI